MRQKKFQGEKGASEKKRDQQLDMQLHGQFQIATEELKAHEVFQKWLKHGDLTKRNESLIMAKQGHDLHMKFIARIVYYTTSDPISSCCDE